MRFHEPWWLARVKAAGRVRGFLTYRQLCDLLPSEIVDPEQIEGIVNELEDFGISVVEETRLEVVQRALRHWDPIGVITDPRAMESASDEYNSYALRILELIESGARALDLALRLAALRVDAMMLGSRQPTGIEENIARLLAVWRDGGYVAAPDFPFARGFSDIR